jgi:hypothetical protein
MKYRKKSTHIIICSDSRCLNKLGVSFGQQRSASSLHAHLRDDDDDDDDDELDDDDDELLDDEVSFCSIRTLSNSPMHVTRGSS